MGKFPGKSCSSRYEQHWAAIKTGTVRPLVWLGWQNPEGSSCHPESRTPLGDTRAITMPQFELLFWSDNLQPSPAIFSCAKLGFEPRNDVQIYPRDDETYACGFPRMEDLPASPLDITPCDTIATRLKYLGDGAMVLTCVNTASHPRMLPSGCFTGDMFFQKGY